MQQLFALFYTCATARIYSEGHDAVCWDAIQGGSKMTNRKGSEFKVRRPNSRTMSWLTKAQSGEIPVSVLEKVSLDKQDVADFLSANIPIMRSSAKGAGLGTLAMFFDELDTVLQQV
jgi:hypothetical protein